MIVEFAVLLSPWIMPAGLVRRLEMATPLGCASLSPARRVSKALRILRDENVVRSGVDARGNVMWSLRALTQPRFSCLLLPQHGEKRCVELVRF